ncbi:conserved hypothetical protein [Vibrio jasicida]|uniref:Uncharacterized protein n=1 Tax=Vibrio jasicida TaxID=766224 RepID=A0AAU9QJY2_9VIBR|nr:conserved hypothetical protein [Vibrio jasicida]
MNNHITILLIENKKNKKNNQFITIILFS